jgi:D-alanyl-D-alanine carboxypeptidase
MSDVGLRSLSIHVEYKPAMLGKNAASMTLPSLAVVEVTTPLQHWRNTHVFDAYKSFSTDAEQDANVKIRAESATPKKDNITTTATSDDREKP